MTAKDIRTGQTVRFPRFTNHITVEVVEVPEWAQTEATTVVQGRRVTQNGTRYSRVHMYSMAANAEVEEV